MTCVIFLSIHTEGLLLRSQTKLCSCHLHSVLQQSQTSGLDPAYVPFSLEAHSSRLLILQLKISFRWDYHIRTEHGTVVIWRKWGCFVSIQPLKVLWTELHTLRIIKYHMNLCGPTSVVSEYVLFYQKFSIFSHVLMSTPRGNIN